MKKKILFSIIAVISLNGCSAIKARFFKPADTLTTSKPMEYNFIQPRRAPLATDMANRLKLTPDGTNSSFNRFSYYSANGNRCQTLSLDNPRAACFVNGRWQEAAPILVAKTP